MNNDYNGQNVIPNQNLGNVDTNSQSVLNPINGQTGNQTQPTSTQNAGTWPAQPLQAQSAVMQQNIVSQHSGEQIPGQNIQPQDTVTQSISSEATPKKKNNIVLIVAIALLAIVAVAILIVNLGKNGNSNNSSNTSTSSGDNTVTNNSNNNLNDSSDNKDDSSEITPLYTYGEIYNGVQLKVNSKPTISDEFHQVIDVTMKNNSSENILLLPSSKSSSKSVFAYFETWFIYKGVDISNATEEDYIKKFCNLSSFDGVSSSEIRARDEEIMLEPGKDLNLVINCPITGIKDNANGVEALILIASHSSVEKNFALREINR